MSTAPIKTLAREGRQVLTRANIAQVDSLLDREGVYAKAYWQTVDGKSEIVGLRIGTNPGRVVAFFGDTIIRAMGGGFIVQRPETLTAEQWNWANPIGTPVTAYSGSRDGDSITTRTRTAAWTAGHGRAVVMVENAPTHFALTHVDVTGGAL